MSDLPVSRNAGKDEVGSLVGKIGRESRETVQPIVFFQVKMNGANLAEVPRIVMRISDIISSINNTPLLLPIKQE